MGIGPPNTIMNTLRERFNNPFRNTLRELIVYEKVIIYCPSFLVCAYVLIQLMVLAELLDSGYDNNKEHQTLFEQWYGFWIMSPTFVFDFILVVYVSFEKQIRSHNIASRDINIEEANLRRFKVDQAADDFGMGVDDDEDQDSDDEGGAGGGSESVMDTSAEEETRVISLNVSLMNKWLWTLPSFFFAACKISWDRRSQYSWKFVISPLVIYMGYFLWIAYTKQNWFWQDQRDIDRAEKRELRMEAIMKAISKRRTSKKMNEGVIKSDTSVDL
jgi:uncharacterized membrane protein (DUF485 family)